LYNGIIDDIEKDLKRNLLTGGEKEEIKKNIEKDIVEEIEKHMNKGFEEFKTGLVLDDEQRQIDDDEQRQIDKDKID
jgi:hypothetical protein